MNRDSAAEIETIIRPDGQSCPSLVPLSRRRSRKGINQGPNKTRLFPGGEKGVEEGGVRRRGKTLIILRQTHTADAGRYTRCRTRAAEDTGRGGFILYKGSGRERERSSALVLALARRGQQVPRCVPRSSAKTTPL